MKSELLLEYIDWPKVMLQPRNSGGHEEVMRSLFRDSTVLAHVREDSWSGTVSYIYLIHPPEPGGAAKIIVAHDYFGSCSGCDAWEGANDETAKELCESIARNCDIFDSVEEAVEYLKLAMSDEASYYGLYRVAGELLGQLSKIDL